MIVAVISFAEVDEKVEEDELGCFFEADVGLEVLDAVVKLPAFVGGAFLKVDFVEDLFELKEKIHRVSLVGEITVKNALDCSVAVVPKQLVEILQVLQEELAVY